MTTQSFAQLMEQAAAEGFTNELLPDGPQVVELTTVKPGTAQNGNPQIGVRLKVVGGPLDGKSTWDNININPNIDAIDDAEKRSKAIRGNGFAFARLGTYGVPPTVVASATSVEQIASNIVVGTHYNAELGHRDFGGKTYQNVNKVSPIPVQAPSPAPAAPPVAAAPVSAPAPATAAPESAPPPVEPAAAPAPPKVPF